MHQFTLTQNTAKSFFLSLHKLSPLLLHLLHYFDIVLGTAAKKLQTLKWLSITSFLTLMGNGMGL